MRRWHLVVLAVATAATVGGGLAVPSAVPAADAADCTPSQALDLKNWKLQTPRGAAGGGIVEIKQPQLAGYTEPPHFVSRGCNGIAFRAPVDGAHTSGSRFARTELREMTNGGRTNAAWSSTVGTHTFTETIAFTALPKGKPDVVGAQIHNAAEDISLLKVRGNRLFVTDAGRGVEKLVDANYQLGEQINMKWVVSGGVTKAYVNGVLQLTFTRNYSGAYFKAGAYPQADCSTAKPCDDSNYGATVITKLAVSHSGGGAEGAESAGDDQSDDQPDDESDGDPDFDF